MFKDKLMSIAQLFGIGRIEFAPGSWASLVTCIILYPILGFGLGVKITLIIIISILGVYAADYAEKKLNEKDPQSVVIDEVAGQFITLTFIAKPSFLSVFLGFILFRILDVFIFDLSCLNSSGLQKLFHTRKTLRSGMLQSQ